MPHVLATACFLLPLLLNFVDRGVGGRGVSLTDPTRPVLCQAVRAGIRGVSIAMPSERVQAECGIIFHTLAAPRTALREA